VVYAALKSAPVPLAHRPLMEMVTAAQDPRYNVVEGIGHVSKTKIRGVFSLLKTSGCFQLTNEGPEEFVFLSLGQGLQSFKDFKERHDDYIRQCWRHMQFLPPERIRGHVVWELDEPTLRRRLMEFKQLFEKIETFYRRDFHLLELSENKVGNNNSNNNNSNYSAGNNNNTGRRQQPQQQQSRGNIVGNYSSYSHHQTTAAGGGYSSSSFSSSSPFVQELQQQQRGQYHQQMNNDSLLSSSPYSRGIGNSGFPLDSTSSPGSSFFSASLPLPVSSVTTSTDQNNNRQSPSLFHHDHGDYDDYYSSENYSEQTQPHQPQYLENNNINNNNNIESNGFPFQAGNPSSASSTSFFSSSFPPSSSSASKLVLSDSLALGHFAATDEAADDPAAVSLPVENYATGNINEINSSSDINDYFQFNNERGNL
jgi:hypothetical protein